MNITIIVSPRERFSNTRQSLESIYQHTPQPFDLVYVDGGSPKPVQQYLEAQAAEKGFKLIRCDRYLAPNQARNIGLEHADSKYVLFIDNDVVVTPGWSDKLVNCAEETDATIVCPLTCIGQPLHETVHLAGGEARLLVETKGEKTIRRVHEKHYFVNRPVADIKDQLHRQQCEFAEFHCMLVRREIFAQIGLLDEGLLSTREHIDFCLSVAQAGGTVYCEPESVVTYVTGKLEWSDLPFFFLRWSD
ncbi:MAG: glycosyltransferase, partial [Geitlerinemataceae cyanobacterium]